ncbi:TlpA disulfide reductase family protein [Ulvibacterium sp.]|uniref:TlpA family protein disulfide reductase n=1 Tax=Ulvibacterium sp. TaxID=2665914 RepID=UPI0026355172|nr:TlpA disulfide reductase family protein [Ulvibacterium sp.]
MKFKYLYLVFSILAISCQDKKTISIFLDSDLMHQDTVFLTEFTTDRILALIPLSSSKFNFEVPANPTIGKIKFGDDKQRYLSILEGGTDLRISVKSDTTIVTNHVRDSLLTYLWRSNNAFFADHGNFIFKTQDLDSLRSLFEEFRINRREVIQGHKEQLNEEMEDLLHYQNDARIYSFLFFYGRMVKNLDYKNSFFDFAQHVDGNSIWAKTFTSNALYTYELEYLRENDSITNIGAFLDFVEQKTRNGDNADFLKSIYIKSLMERPHYWPKHEDLLNSESLRELIKREKSNRYFTLIEQLSKVYLATQKGEMAYDFTAENLKGEKVKLSDYRGKIVFIDNWASWCGPCIAGRPRLKKMAARLRERDDIAFLFVSLDVKKTNWMDFLENEESPMDYHSELFIKKGMSTDYGKNYNIKFIPKYMLIDKEGLVVDSNLKNLDKSERQINTLLKEQN